MPTTKETTKKNTLLLTHHQRQSSTKRKANNTQISAHAFGIYTCLFVFFFYLIVSNYKRLMPKWLFGTNPKFMYKIYILLIFLWSRRVRLLQLETRTHAFGLIKF